MIESKEFSTVTKNYLSRYYEILDEMKQGMCEPALTESISHNFIVQMIPHHQAAIEMSNNLLQYTTFVPLQNIAAHIIASQTKSIADMRAALAQCSELPNTEQELCLYARRFEQITQTMFTDMGNATATNHMAENTLRFPICPALVPILQSIITSQQEGVCKMERLLCSLNCAQ